MDKSKKQNILTVSPQKETEAAKTFIDNFYKKEFDRIVFKKDSNPDKFFGYFLERLEENMNGINTESIKIFDYEPDFIFNIVNSFISTSILLGKIDNIKTGTYTNIESKLQNYWNDLLHYFEEIGVHCHEGNYKRRMNKGLTNEFINFDIDSGKEFETIIDKEESDEITINFLSKARELNYFSEYVSELYKAYDYLKCLTDDYKKENHELDIKCVEKITHLYYTSKNKGDLYKMYAYIKNQNNNDEKCVFEQKLYLFLFLFIKDLDTRILESKPYEIYIDTLEQKMESIENKKIKIDDLENAEKDIENKKKSKKKFLFF